MAKRKTKVPVKLQDKVLVAKVGKEVQFMEKIAQATEYNSFGWKEIAKLVRQLDRESFEDLTLREIEQELKRATYDSIMQYAEWMTPEEAAKREKIFDLLYSDLPKKKARSNG